MKRGRRGGVRGDGGLGDPLKVAREHTTIDDARPITVSCSGCATRLGARACDLGGVGAWGGGDL